MRKLFLLCALVVFSTNLTFAQKQVESLGNNNTQQIELLSGATTVHLSSDFVNALTALNLTPGRVFPAALGGGRITFPITDGTLERQTLRGEIIHNGGLTLTRENTEVKLKSFIIDTSGEGIILTGLVSANGTVVARIPLFDLQLTSNVFNTSFSFRRVALNDVLVTLRPEAADALNGVFQTNAFVPGFNIGTARLRGYGYSN
jgi:hypothetical protein